MIPLDAACRLEWSNLRLIDLQSWGIDFKRELLKRRMEPLLLSLIGRGAGSSMKNKERGLNLTNRCLKILTEFSL